MKKRVSRKHAETIFEEAEGEVEKEIRDAERWIHERRKFLIKLAGLIAFILLIIAIDLSIK